jgi:hypothetical protein
MTTTERGTYSKGTVVQVHRADRQGNPTSSVERDVHGDLWHVKAGDENAKPRQVRPDELDSLSIEEGQGSDTQQ